MPVNILNFKKEKKISELVIEKSVELFGFTPTEKSDENLKWMKENGYQIKVKIHSNRGRR